MSKTKKHGRKKPIKQKAAIQDLSGPVKERLGKILHHDGLRLGNGIEKIDTSILPGGMGHGSAHINRLEASALDGLKEAGVLTDPRDSEASKRRHAAGEILRRIFQESGMHCKGSGSYDKGLNEMLPSGAQHPESEHELDMQVTYKRLMQLMAPFHTVAQSVCCYGERPPTVVRSMSKTYQWDDALRRALDALAGELMPEKTPSRRRRVYRTDSDIEMEGSLKRA